MENENEQEMINEKESEDWCFVCKDGGDLMLCDYQDCLKVYHLGCVEKDDSFSETGEHWTCNRHSCFVCHKAPDFHCLCCPNAVCGPCINAAGFSHVRVKKGLCNSCLNLVLLVERHEELDSDEDTIDLKDRNTYECLFLEYWEIIKEKEGLTVDDVYSAEDFWKKGEEVTKQITADSDLDNSEYLKTMGKEKGSKVMEFIGWGSKPLIDFLTSIGKDTSKQLSQYDVEMIICDYILENNLLDLKRKKVCCDGRLYSIFRKKSVQKNRIYKLLEAHFAENLEQSENDSHDEDESSMQGKEEKITVPHKKQRTNLSSDERALEELDSGVQLSSNASIVADNIKLVYLRRSLVEELLKQPESFEGKAVGSFVKVKNDPRDILQRNSHQLLQVIGIKRTSTTDEIKSEILLQVPYVPADVRISMLSDFDFKEEEIEDLKQKVKNGLLKQPTVEELEQKARSLHEDITKQWIATELVRLQKLIDLTNEKGWRAELAKYLDRRELLKTASEQLRLLQEVPKVIADVVELEPASVAASSID